MLIDRSRPGWAQRRGAALIALTLLLALVPATRASVSAAESTTTQRTEGQQMSGSWTQVTDAQATSGTAVVINSGALSAQTVVAPGSYTLGMRLRSGAARVALTMNGQQIGTAVLYGGQWRTVSMPVRLNAPATIAVQRLEAIGYVPQPVYVDWMSLDPTTPGLTTAGNKIIGAGGQPITPRGVNRDGYQFKPQGTYYIGDNDYAAMYAWGATIVRVPLNQQYWLASSCDYDPTYVQRVDAAVQSITSRGMVALVNLHYAAMGSLCAPSGLVPMADDYSLRFWTEVANRYKSNALVAFDLFNEPHDISEAVWHDGGMVGNWHAVGMQQLYDTVRATGATNLTFVSGVGWAFRIDVALRRPIDGYGIVYGSHVYNPPYDAGPLPSNIDSVIPPVAARYPVVFTELGSMSGSAVYNKNVIDYAESKGVGWLAWKWYTVPSDYALLADFTTYTPSPAGAPVRDALMKARGWSSLGGLAPQTALPLSSTAR